MPTVEYKIRRKVKRVYEHAELVNYMVGGRIVISGLNLFYRKLMGLPYESKTNSDKVERIPVVEYFNPIRHSDIASIKVEMIARMEAWKAKWESKMADHGSGADLELEVGGNVVEDY